MNRGDTSLGLKIAPGGSGDTGTFSWAALGQVSFANGDQDFSNGAKQYTLGVTGQAEEALDHLTRAIRLNPANRIQARSDPDFIDMADDPRFTELLYPESS